MLKSKNIYFLCRFVVFEKSRIYPLSLFLFNSLHNVEFTIFKFIKYLRLKKIKKNTEFNIAKNWRKYIKYGL